MAEGHRRVLAVVVVLVAVFGVTTLGGAEGEGGAYISSWSPAVVEAAQAPAEVATTTTTTPPAPVPTTAPQTRPALATTTRPWTPTSTTAAAPPSVPVTSTTTARSCRNSTDPACGPFRFDPQPGPDRPMSVHIVVSPAAPAVGQDVEFEVTLTDPDGVSYASSTYNWGDSGIGESSVEPCTKFGPWDPPAPDPTHANEVVTLRHTYTQPGPYRVVFIFGAGPYDCVDSVSGRGDRPYASSASGTVTIDVS